MTHTAVLQLFEGGRLIDSVSFAGSDTPISIGRDPGAHLCLDHQKVSRRHAAIDFDGSAFCVRDLGSTNGTFLNEVPVEWDVLRNGDVVRVGDVMLAVTVPQSNLSDRRSDAEMDAMVTLATPGDRRGS